MAVKYYVDGDAPMAANGLAGSKKFYIFAVVLVLATLPHSTYEFAFKFGSDDENDASLTDGTGGKKSSMQRRQIEKRFKFHKIERIYADDEEDNGNENDDDNGNEGTSRNAKYKDSEEEAELQFERVRKAQKPHKEEKRKKSKSKEKIEEETSFLDTIFEIFSFGKQKKAKIVEQETSSNGIIDWILWLGEKTGRIGTSAPEKEIPSDADTWISYLNRWPFNSVFPFGKSEKSMKMPRQAGRDSSKSSRRTGDRYNHDDEDDDDEPMSEAHFENLLHSLPGFVVNAKNVPHSADVECRQQLQVFHHQLRAKKLWTLQMIDATGKITSGLLRGNINQFGDFDLCTQVKAVVKVTPDVPMRIRGKYCLAHIELATDKSELKAPIHLTQGRGLVNSHLGNPNHFLSRYTIANWGVCIPTVCPASVVQEMLEMNFSPYNRTGIEFHVEIDDNDCAVRPVKHVTKLLRKDQNFAIVVALILIHIILVLAALIADYSSVLNEIFQGIRQIVKEKIGNSSSTEKKSDATTGESESAHITLEDKDEKLDEAEVNEESLAKENNEGKKDLDSDLAGLKQILFDILKSYSPKHTLTELLSQERLDMEFPIFHLLKLLSSLMLYVCLKFIMIGHLPIINRDKLVRFFDQPLSVFFRTPFFYADLLLLLNGFTVAYKLSEEMAEKRYIQLLKRLTTKFARYLPTMFLVLAFQTYVLPHLGTGPLWSNLIGQHAQICEQEMWRNGLSVQNAIDFEDTCSPMTIQIALQIQLYLLGPLLVWLYYTDADAAFFVYGGLHALSVAVRYSRTNLEQLSMTIFHGIHVSKFYRSANLLYSSPIARATPYLLGIGAGLVYRSEMGNVQIINNMIPLGWILSVLSVIWCFWSPSSGMNTEFIYNSNEAASYAAWSPLISGMAICWLIFMLPKVDSSMVKFLCASRPILFLSRIAYPLQLVTYIVVLQSTASVRETFKFHITDLVNFNEIGAILFYATVVAFLIDIPAQQIRYILVNRLFVERPLVQEPESEAETNETKKTDDKNDNAEVAETIWSSDPEEEERNYIERRRSSIAEQAVTEVAAKVESENIQESKNDEADEEEEDDADISEEAEVKRRP